jgi:UDP-N-acetylmuramoyl-L-alanyl-D-glutamate--2,6-diaminopimelate ligase
MPAGAAPPASWRPRRSRASRRSRSPTRAPPCRIWRRRFTTIRQTELRLIGITGTLGKTSTMLLLGDILEADRKPVGVVGSLGIKLAEATQETGITTPDASVLQEALRWFADQGVGHVAMEVTSHALSQRRVDGLHFCLGLLTNLVPDEHLEYHPTPEHYLETKMRFLEFLEPARRWSSTPTAP